MKLLNSFFHIVNNSNSNSGITSTIKLNPEHIVYTGHFPGHPVTPGVIQMQIIHELLEINFGRNLKLKSLSHGKFLKIIDPHKVPELNIRIEFTEDNELVIVNATGDYENNIYFKIIAKYRLLP